MWQNAGCIYSLNVPVLILWWQLSVSESKNYYISRHSCPPPCYCFMCTHKWLSKGCVITHTGQDGVPNVSVVVSPLKSRCCQMRRIRFIFHCGSHSEVVSLLLILAGDVETNPGPGKVIYDNKINNGEQVWFLSFDYNIV